MDNVTDVHDELEFQKYAPELRNVAGVWKQIVALQAKARGDKAALAKYKAYLARCIQTVKVDDPMLTSERQEQAAQDFNVWLARRKEELEIARRESGRWPTACEAWCEKNLPAEYTNVVVALAAACDRPSKRTLQVLRSAYEDMLQKYVSAV